LLESPVAAQRELSPSLVIAPGESGWYTLGMSKEADHPPRPEPERLRARPLSREAFLQTAAKTAQLTVKQRAKGRKRAALGHYPERASRAQLYEGYKKAPRCTAEKRDGTRCRLPVVRGSDRCVHHEGVERAPHCPAAGRWYLEGKLRPPRGRYKTHPSALLAGHSSGDDTPEEP